MMIFFQVNRHQDSAKRYRDNDNGCRDSADLHKDSADLHWDNDNGKQEVSNVKCLVNPVPQPPAVVQPHLSCRQIWGTMGRANITPLGKAW